MAVDVKDLKVGDEVLVRLFFSHTQDGQWAFYKNTAAEDLRVHSTSIVQHTPRPIKVGDRVRRPAGAVEGVVLAIDEGEAWVRWDIGQRGVLPTFTLERVS